MIGYGYSYFVSTILDTESGTAPVNTVAPVISGGTSLGSILSSTTGTWTGTPTITYAYQWKRNGNNIGSATNSTYTITLFDTGANITCEVTATNAIGSSSAISNTITVQIFSAPVNTVAPAITGTAQEGQTLTCSTGTWTGNPTPTYAYQWKRNNVNIGSATNSTYLLVSADVGQSIKCTVTATNAIGSVNADSNSVTPIAAVDPDAQAFITAASITNPTQQSAINDLVVGLKADGLWTKMKAVYPMVGGTSTSTTYNLKNTSQYQISWVGGVTWSNNGVQFNNINSYGNTGLIPSSALTLNSTHMSFYSRTTGNVGVDDFGANNSVNQTMRVIIKDSGTSNHYLDMNSVSQRITGTVADSTGFFLCNRETSTALRSLRNNVSLGSNTNTNTGTLPSVAMYLGGLNNNGSFANPSGRQCAFASVGDGLTTTDQTNLYNRVQTFNTALARQV